MCVCDLLISLACFQLPSMAIRVEYGCPLTQPHSHRSIPSPGVMAASCRGCWAETCSQNGGRDSTLTAVSLGYRISDDVDCSMASWKAASCGSAVRTGLNSMLVTSWQCDRESISRRVVPMLTWPRGCCMMSTRQWQLLIGRFGRCEQRQALSGRQHRSHAARFSWRLSAWSIVLLDRMCREPPSIATRDSRWNSF